MQSLPRILEVLSKRVDRLSKDKKKVAAADTLFRNSSPKVMEVAVTTDQVMKRVEGMNMLHQNGLNSQIDEKAVYRR